MTQPYAIESMPPVMDAEECAARLRCEVRTIENLVARQILESIQIGGKRRFRATDVIAFIEGRGPNRRPRAGRRKRGAV